MNFLSNILILGLLLVSIQIHAAAKNSEFENDVHKMREFINNERLDLIKGYMGLTAFEEKQFLGVYNRYRDAMKPIVDQQAKLAADYVTAYTSNKLTDKLADQFTRTMLDLAARKVATRKKFVSEFQVFLKPRSVARFIQLENKLDAIMSYDLARNIPLVPTGNPKAPANIRLE
jgi:hypothetical protein